ncbi:MAG: MdtA/MuxA family multidrug efflux RND transporter periplasmic adaptor subunit [Alphaproteobacteria bacterium]|nr:MdtA/MuxA family multidrug efflux RND transporter periplasmic adaptor subunit [Alphaproteobacteria bacterium]MDE1986413.1 MdtA/MuxA family multidrug efflux RND transporter periplasmic adaptor subunit [Alphaproteobacteria bacterium]
MNSHSDDASRFQSASDGARRNFEQARLRFGTAGDRVDPYLKKAGGYVGDIRRWSSNHLPGGEKSLWVAIGLIVLIAFVWAILPGQTAIDAGRVGMNGPQPVGVAVAKKGNIDLTIDALGTVTPLATVTVRPQVSGQLLRIDFQEGQRVKAGALLAEIDPRPYQAALDQAKGQLARDSALLTNARLDLKRQQALYAAKATSQQVLDTQQTLVKQDEGIVLSDQANVETAAINLGYTRITSPVAGLAGLRQVDVGNFVSAGQSTGVVVVTQLEPMSVVFAVPEDSVDSIVSRMNSGATLQVSAYDRDQTTKLASGKLSAVDSQIDTTTGTVKLRALFDNEDGVLFPNQFVNVRLLVRTLHGQIVIPASAIQRGTDGAYVFVVKPDHTIQMRTVTLGPQQGDSVSIVKGLNVGETVVTDGGDRLRDGAAVTIPSGEKVAKVVPAQNAVAVTPNPQEERRALFRKLTPAEREQLRGMAPDARRAWMKSHRDELMKRKDQPGGGFGGGGR